MAEPDPMAEPEPELLYERRGPAAVVTFNRPQARNAMTFAMYEALSARCEEVDADDDIRVLILRGAGGKAFVSGTDIRQFLDFDSGRTGVQYEADIDRYVGRVDRVRKPTIALVDGYAVGAGLSISAACDLRICTPDARFGLPIARTLGNCLSMAGYARLVAILGEARAKDVVFTARMVGAEEALACGLATAVVPADEIEEHVFELADTLACHAPITLRVTKEALRRIREANVPDGADLVEEAYGSNDFRQGVAAFLEKRRHTWTGS
jgi:enoyl-CoA hydratase